MAAALNHLAAALNHLAAALNHLVAVLNHLAAAAVCRDGREKKKICDKSKIKRNFVMASPKVKCGY